MWSEVYGQISDTKKEIRAIRRELNAIRNAKRQLRALNSKKARLEKALEQEGLISRPNGVSYNYGCGEE